MINDNPTYYIARIFEEVKARLLPVCPNIFGSRPASVKDSMKDFLVVTLPYEIEEKGPYQSSVWRVEIYARNKSQGVLNLGRLDKLANDIAKLFPYKTTDKRITFFSPKLKLQGDDNNGFYVWNLQGGLMVNKTDSY